jgi:glycosyltransferase involved in cell wall biosynthesis
MSSKLVTILINNYNYGRYLREAIDSALAQDYHALEIVVVDDGSTDESRSVIADYAGKIKPVLKPNGGQASAFNAGFAASRGDIICLLDSDDWFRPGKVRAVAEVFAAFREASWVFHPLQMSFPDGSIECKSETSTQFFDQRDRSSRYGKLRGTAPPTSGLCFHRRLLERLLPMPEEIQITSDNYLKFAAMSLTPGVYLDKGLAVQRIHDRNAYTLRANRLPMQARIHLLIADALKNKFPELTRLSDKIFAKALADYIATGKRDPLCRAVIRRYIGQAELGRMADIVPRTGYHFIKRHLLSKIAHKEPIG